jgi:hypothetical protein
MTKATSNVPATLSAPDYEKLLLEAGFLTQPSGTSNINRLRVKNNNIQLGDDIIASYNAKTKEPALIVQLVDTPEQYQSMWFEKDAALANAVGRPEIAGHFCRSYFDKPAQAREFAEDGTSCKTCEVRPFLPPARLPAEAIAQQGASRCAWRGDIQLRILTQNEDGTLKAEDETIYTMGLPTTSMIEFVGSNSKNAEKLAGSVSEYHFMAKLAALGMEKWGPEGLQKALTFLRMGGVVAEVRLLPASNKDKSRDYTVTSFTPIDILEVTEVTQIETSETDDAADSVPF